MALDIEKLRNRLAKKTEGTDKPKYERPQRKYFVPEAGKKYLVRFIDKSVYNDGDQRSDPFTQLWFYYGFTNYPLLSLKRNFDKADPFAELQQELYAQKTPETKELAKKFYPKDRYYAPVLVRGEEEKGTQWFAISKTNMDAIQDMLDNYGDITDLDTGRDIIVTVKDSGKKMKDNDRPVLTFTFLAKEPCKIFDDKTTKESLKFLKETFDPIESYFSEKSYDEMKKILDQWLSANAKSSSTHGMKKGNAIISNDDIDNAFDTN